jgi:hypothetical protein
MRVTDFCNCESRHEHLHERSTLEVSPALSRRRHARWNQGPSGQLEWAALDGANTSFGSLDHAFSII